MMNINNFFDSISFASKEKIHSQTICWLLSQPEDIFSLNEKIKFLKVLLKLDDLIEPVNIKCLTEYDSIDIIISCDKHIFVIENKLKSSEHSNQTEKYSKSIEERDNGNKTILFFYLSLIKEIPINSKWKILQYADLLNALKSIELAEQSNQKFILSEYKYCVQNIVFAYDTFIKDHKRFPNVFKDGNKKKSNKNEIFEDEVANYISKNQLETIFQKALLKIIASEIKEQNYFIGETQGTALIQYNLGIINSNFGTFNIGFQLQGITAKINIVHTNYNHSKKEDVTQELFELLEQRVQNKNGYIRFNKPKTKAYISVSKQLERQLYDYDLLEIKQIIEKEIKFVKQTLINTHSIELSVKHMSD